MMVPIVLLKPELKLKPQFNKYRKTDWLVPFHHAARGFRVPETGPVY